MGDEGSRELPKLGYLASINCLQQFIANASYSNIVLVSQEQNINYKK